MNETPQLIKDYESGKRQQPKLSETLFPYDSNAIDFNDYRQHEQPRVSTLKAMFYGLLFAIGILAAWSVITVLK